MYNRLWGFLIFFLLIAVLVIVSILGFAHITRPAETGSPIAQLNEHVNVYRVGDLNINCYVVVGYLHGYTVAIDCLEIGECR